MNNTLIISESHYGTSKKVGDILSLILGFSKHLDVSEAPHDISKYNNIILITSFHGYNTAEKLNEYLPHIKEQLSTKKLGLIFVGLVKDNLSSYKDYLLKNIEFDPLFIEFVSGNLIIESLTLEDKEVIKNFFAKHNLELKDIKNFKEEDVISLSEKIRADLSTDNKQMLDDDLKEEIDKFISSHNTCSLASGYGCFIRNTPIEFIYHDNNFYFFTEGGLKFAGILQNPNVCISIFDNYKDMNKIRGLQISGKSSIIDIGSSEYIAVAAKRNLNLDMINKFPVNLNLIKVIPQRYEYLNSKFTKKGFASKQILYNNI